MYRLHGDLLLWRPRATVFHHSIHQWGRNEKGKEKIRPPSQQSRALPGPIRAKDGGRRGFRDRYFLAPPRVLASRLWFLPVNVVQLPFIIAGDGAAEYALR